jgi:prepilin-type N-terminal cleavage/methylation domain-containing protein
MNHVGSKRGFTLIELMLAMAFVSALMIAVAMTVIQIANTYNRGLTLKEVNQAGNDLANELQRSIASASKFDISGGQSRYVVNKFGGEEVGGRLCTGQYTYIWNIGKAISDNTNRNKYDSGTDEIRFIKVVDSNADYCGPDMTAVARDKAIEILGQGEHELAIHNFSITTSATADDSVTGQRLYSINFTLGTNIQSAMDRDADGAIFCRLRPDLGADPAYCYVNRFEIVARAGNLAE